MFCRHEMGGFDGKQTAVKYLDILADLVHPEVVRFYPSGDRYFMMTMQLYTYIVPEVFNPSDDRYFMMTMQLYTYIVPEVFTIC
ncbi:hypothetical protein TNCV_545471 [Trichonephila clavipes]|nr:hypothetical protein TNCV_545471 [Trichonephila clavipes]